MSGAVHAGEAYMEIHEVTDTYATTHWVTGEASGPV